MNRMWAVAKREFRAYFNSPVAYIVVSLFLLLVGTLFWITFFAPPAALSMREFFIYSSLVLIFYAPAVTMRLLAEERGSGHTVERKSTDFLFFSSGGSGVGGVGDSSAAACATGLFFRFLLGGMRGMTLLPVEL